MPRVLAYHLVLGAYGFWLPNDPRGSGSWFVGSDKLFRHGRATHVRGERSVANDPHDAKSRRDAKKDLKYPAVRLDGGQARCIALAFGEAGRRNGIVIHACAVMPNHAHLVVLRHARLTAEEMMVRLKAEASKRLRLEGLHPFQHHEKGDGSLPKVWARDGRHRFLSSPDTVRKRIKYVEDNPVKDGLKKQVWSFVVGYQG